MPKRGQTQPHKIDFQYPGQKSHRIAHGNLEEAFIEAQKIANRGADVVVTEQGGHKTIVTAQPDEDED